MKLYLGSQPLLIDASGNHPLYDGVAAPWLISSSSSLHPTPFLPRDHACVPLWITFLSVTDKPRSKPHTAQLFSLLHAWQLE